MSAERLSAVATLVALCAVMSAAALPKYPKVMELSTRPWLYELSRKYGRTITSLRDIPLGEFTRYKKMGMDIIWMMGVWRLGPYGVQHDRTDPCL